MTRCLHLFVLSALLVPAARAGDAQNPPRLDDPATYRRPKLSSAADPNDWEGYFDYGVEQLRRDPRKAEAAFYWASRIDPSRAEPLYGRWVAYWMRRPAWFEEYVKGDPKLLAAPAVVEVDSLYLRALGRNPLMPRTLTVLVYDQLPGRWSGDRFTTAILDYSRGQYADAVAAFGRLVRDDPAGNYRVRYYRALGFTAMQRFDSASGEITALLEEMRRRDEKQLTYSYQSKELIEYALGLLQLASGDRAAARAAFQRALVENLAFYPAHAALGEMALASRDNKAALDEYGLAVELGGSDGVERYQYGSALAAAGRPEEAELQLRKGIELEPLFAPPYFTLGTVLEARRLPRQALAAYRDYVQRAPSLAPLAPRAQARMAALNGPKADSGGAPPRDR